MISKRAAVIGAMLSLFLAVGLIVRPVVIEVPGGIPGFNTADVTGENGDGSGAEVDAGPIEDGDSGIGELPVPVRVESFATSDTAAIAAFLTTLEAEGREYTIVPDGETTHVYYQEPIESVGGQ